MPMRRNVRRPLTISVLLLALPVTLAVVPSAGAAPTPPWQVHAAWRFDTISTGSVADASGHGRSLRLAGEWSAVTGRSGTGAARFDMQSYGTVSGRGPSAGVREVAVTAVLRSTVRRPTGDHPNVLQHGLFADRSQIKMQITKDGTGRASCRFAGTRAGVVVTGPAIDVTDGGWHSVTCWRRDGTLGVTVDGVHRVRHREVGSIDPIRPMTVAARGLTAGAASDQFCGDLDVVVWAVGDGARQAAVKYATTLAAG